MSFLRRCEILILCFIFIFAGALFGDEQDLSEKSLSEIRGQTIDQQYIVVLKDQQGRRPDLVAGELVRAHGGSVLLTYQHAIQGFSGRFTDEEARRVARDPRVKYIEPDRIATILAVQPEPDSWGIDRVDQRDLELDSAYYYDFDGTGVNAYILDTGIRYSHQEFSGRASFGTDTIGGDGSDCHGHGTHVAGTVGGRTHGVAKNVNLFAVRVLDCSGSGSYSQVIAGVDWVTANHQAPAVANMSLGGSKSQALNDAVEASIEAGVFYSLAAGNEDRDACNVSPASTEDAVTVSSTDSADQRSSFSNWGECLDLFAPGSYITSAWHTSDSAESTLSGTSMAAPHVAGVAALLWDEDPGLSEPELSEKIIEISSKGRVGSPGCHSPNRLLYGLTDGSDGGPDEPDSDDCDGGCPFSLAVEERTVFTDEISTTEALMTLYSFRDTLLRVTEKGRRYYNFFYAHSARTALLLLRDQDLLVASSMVVKELLPGLRQIQGEAGDEGAVITPKLVTEVRALIADLARADRAQGGGEMAEAFEKEAARIDWQRLAGMTFAEAWERLPVK